MSFRSQLFQLMAVSLLLQPSLARAQNIEAPRVEPPPWSAPPDPTVWLDLVGDEPMTVTVYSTDDGPGGERPLFTCQTPCRVRVWPARYRFHVRASDPDKIESDRLIEVASSQQLSFSLPKRSSKTATLTMAITGTALIPAGLLVAFAAALSNSCMDCPPEETRNRQTPAGVYVGLGMAAVGAILAPIGWISFAQNRRPNYETLPLGSGPRAPASRPEKQQHESPRVGFGILPTRGGAGAGVWGSF